MDSVNQFTINGTNYDIVDKNLANFIKEKGMPLGLAVLDSNAKVLESQLPENISSKNETELNGTNVLSANGAYEFFNKSSDRLAWLGYLRKDQLGYVWKLAQLSTPISSKYNLRKVKYANGVYVAIGDNASLWWSTDGERWTLSGEIGTALDFADIAYFKNRFIALGTAGIWYSDDGKVWTQALRNKYTNYAISNDLIIAYTTNSHAEYKDKFYHRSTDGKIWAEGSLGMGGSGQLYWANNKWVSLGIHRIYASSNGINWNPSLNKETQGELFTDETFNDAVYYNGRWYTSSLTGIWVSTDNAASFTKIISNSGGTNFKIAGDFCFAYSEFNFRYINGTTISIAKPWYGKYQLYTQGKDFMLNIEDNGLTWVSGIDTSSTTSVTAVISNVVYGNNRYVASSNHGIWVSFDGRKWLNTIPSLSFTDVVFANDTFMALSNIGLFRSSDGLYWDKIGFLENTALEDCRFVNGTWYCNTTTYNGYINMWYSNFDTID